MRLIPLAQSASVVDPATGRPSREWYAFFADVSGTALILTQGLTTQLLVGGGSNTLATWVTATGSGAPVRATSPTLVTPVLGVATATSINKVALTQPATGATLTVADGKTLTANASLTLAGTDGKTLTTNASLTLAGTDGKTLTTNASLTLAGTDGKTLTTNASLTLAGTDSTAHTFPSTNSTLARTDAAQTFTGVQTLSSQPILSSLTASQAVFTDGSKGLVSNAITGSGNVVMSASPTLTGTIAGASMTLSGTLGVTGVVSIGNSLNAVSPTSPNRTVTISVNGTTVYLHAKTTND